MIPPLTDTGIHFLISFLSTQPDSTDCKVTPTSDTQVTEFNEDHNSRCQSITIQNSNVERDEKRETRCEEYNALLNENQITAERGLITPKRRSCGFGLFDSIKNATLSTKTSFIKDEEIIGIHPMRFLRNSPFVNKVDLSPGQHPKELDDIIWNSLFEGLDKQLHAIGVTEDGRHVILQQAVKSCVPSCVAMLVLDQRKTPNYEAIRMVSCATLERAIEWVEAAELVPVLTTIKEYEHPINTFQEAIQKNGPGVLQIIHPLIGGHAIILDEISTKTHSAIIRDPFHGWSVTIRLELLLSWIKVGSYFLQACPQGSLSPLED